jgi:hypothetical protein
MSSRRSSRVVKMQFRLIREFCADPAGFLETMLDEPDQG